MNFIKTLLSHSFFLVALAICLSLFTWKTISCIQLFLEKPQSTLVSYNEVTSVPFPEVVLCPYWTDSFYLNQTVLQQCNIDSIQDYNDGNWAGSCSNPEEIYEKALLGPQRMITHVKFLTYNDTHYIYPNTFPGFFKPLDTLQYGRCFSFMAPDDIQKEGILSTEIVVEWISQRVMFTTPGQFLTAKQGIGRNQEVHALLTSPDGGFSTRYAYYHLDLESFETLPTTERDCNLENVNDLDGCLLDKIHEESMRKINCTTPFGRNRSSICTERSKAQEAIEIYMEMFINSDKHCQRTCNFLAPKVFSLTEQEAAWNGHHTFLFENAGRVRKSTSQLTYTSLHMMAEIGGYLGLFLGYALVNVADIFKSLVDKMKWIYKP